MRRYETAFVISPKVEEEELEKIISHMTEIISKKEGKLVKKDNWGKRKLAYPINKFDEAYYVFFLYDGEPDILKELEKNFRRSEKILRYSTVKKDVIEKVRWKRKTKDKKEKKAKEAEESESAEEQKEGADKEKQAEDSSSSETMKEEK
ncbi:MAG: 30S ribosomal protein S6 [Candidatus Aminicenantaceae bacterium]